jgi:hypothetical protein
MLNCRAHMKSRRELSRIAATTVSYPRDNRNEAGELEDQPSYLDTRIDIPKQTAKIADFANAMTRQMSAASGLNFYCFRSAEGRQIH